MPYLCLIYALSMLYLSYIYIFMKKGRRKQARILYRTWQGSGGLVVLNDSAKDWHA